MGDLILNKTFEILAPVINSFQTSDWQEWTQVTLQNILHNVDDTELQIINYPLTCASYQQLYVHVLLLNAICFIWFAGCHVHLCWNIPYGHLLSLTCSQMVELYARVPFILWKISLCRGGVKGRPAQQTHPLFSLLAEKAVPYLVVKTDTHKALLNLFIIKPDMLLILMSWVPSIINFKKKKERKDTLWLEIKKLHF